MGRLRAVVDLIYPTPASMKTVLAAGGLSKLTPAQRERVKFKKVSAGGYCDDLPAVSRTSLLASGRVKETTPHKAGRKK